MYREKLDACIEGLKEEMLEDLKVLVRIDSQKAPAQEGKPFGEGPAKVLEAASGMMERYGLKVTNYDNYVIAGDFGPGEKELDILAHLDVVPVTEDWTVTKPFDPVIVDGKIYGRGTADDKGPAICALYAIRAIKELGIPLKKSVRLILGSDEECGSSDLAYYFSKEKEAPCSFTPDADFPVINLEKARLAKQFCAPFEEEKESPVVTDFQAGDKVNVVPARANAMVRGLKAADVEALAAATAEKTGTTITVSNTADGCKLEVKGLAAHASTPEVGVNALTVLLSLIAQLPLADTRNTRLLKDLAGLLPHGDTVGEAMGVKMEDEISGALTFNPAILKVQEGIITGEFDIRAPLCANDENLTEVMRAKFAGIGMTMEEGNMKPAHYVPADSDFVKTLLASYEQYSGKPGKALAIGGGTYVHGLEHGVAFGCMSEDVDNHMHGDDEFMEIDTMLMSTKIFADVIVKLCM